MANQLFLLKAISGVHCGIGQGLSDIDLPTAREKVSGHPFVPGSSVKGVLRDLVTRQCSHDMDKIEAAFGAADARDVDFASAVVFGDARLLCLPVRSYFGTFAYVASPYTLSLLKAELLRCGLACDIAVPQFMANAEHYKGTATSDTVLKLAGDAQQRILLEEIDLLPEAGNADAVNRWAGQIAGLLYGEGEGAEENRRLFRQRFLVADDNVLNFFCETALPVSARIRIDNKTGTVQRGALWYEEFVPAETVFLGLLSATDGLGKHRQFKADDLLKLISGKALTCQLGGKASTGRGMVSLHFTVCA